MVLLIGLPPLIAQASFQTMLALRMRGATKPLLWWFSNALVLGGSLIYAAVKRNQMRLAKDS